MDARYVTLCFLLIIGLNGNPTSAENCFEFPKVHPFCLKPLCKGNCYLEAKSQGVNLRGYYCDGNGFWGMCVCSFCKH
ncbi:hypothetical protein BDA96_05G006400 [Sorghum bicolor]|uniref:Knottin scorpion toxin-like domain-containing protein n=2 Tax=Sorghum bicolor TaxID=4558 RepID=A0A921QU12_SORBI|nr:hypothetical protein BDA96_05G006400 [Sorghum bicolor]KXG27566.1 hypothetical protein SORBI_3005G006100 [Sorghum bicolor]